jgi:hypothetical protein
MITINYDMAFRIISLDFFYKTRQNRAKYPSGNIKTYRMSNNFRYAFYDHSACFTPQIWQNGPKYLT